MNAHTRILPIRRADEDAVSKVAYRQGYQDGFVFAVFVLVVLMIVAAALGIR